MENQHRKIEGYRELNEFEINRMNQAKMLAEECRRMIDEWEKPTSNMEVPDPRWLAIGKTDLQKGFMAIIRSVAKPETF